MKLEKEVLEEKPRVRQACRFSGEECGYKVFVTTDGDGAMVTLWRSAGATGENTIGIMSFSPDSVAAIEQFAEVANQIFSGIAFGLREHGLDDLRGTLERRVLEMQEPKVEELRRRGNQ